MAFADEEHISPWALAAVKRVVAAGLMKGDDTGNFNPQAPVTREEFAVVLDREILQEAELADADRQALMRDVANVVVHINAGDAIGSGVVVDKRGYILTNAHVVGDNAEVEAKWKSVYANADVYPSFVGPMGKVVVKDVDNDLALVKVEWQGDMDVAHIAADWVDDDYTCRNHIGKSLFIEGSPLGFGGRLDVGIFNGVRKLETTYLDIDGHVNPGNSGGPIFNSKGEFVGIVVAKFVDPAIEGFGLGIPLSRIMPFLNSNIPTSSV